MRYWRNVIPLTIRWAIWLPADCISVQQIGVIVQQSYTREKLLSAFQNRLSIAVLPWSKDWGQPSFRAIRKLLLCTIYSLWPIDWHATESETLRISCVVRGESDVFMRHDTLCSLLAPGLSQRLQDRHATSSCVALIGRGFSRIIPSVIFSLKAYMWACN